VKRSEGKGSDRDSEEVRGNEGEIPFIYQNLYIPPRASRIYKNLGGEKTKK